MSEHTYHEGERELQRLAGESERAEANGRAIAREIVRGALAFVAQQPLLLVASLDEAGQPWAWILTGAPGFATARSPSELVLSGLDAPHCPDELRAQLAADGRVGLLFFEPATRRRLRVNGRARWIARDALEVQVEQSYPNCPRYIQRRELRSVAEPGVAQLTRGTELAAPQLEAIRRADAFFVASRGPDQRLDLSHRGGAIGFVRVTDAGLLRVPDYAGNSMFNTLGNLARDPRAGLLFVDFERGELLQLVGDARLGLEPARSFGAELDTGRSWTFAPRAWRMQRGGFPLRGMRLA